MNTLEFIRDAREPLTEPGYWHEIDTLRKNGIPTGDLPHSYSEFQRQIRALCIAGKLKREGELVVFVPVAAKAERRLFG